MDVDITDDRRNAMIDELAQYAERPTLQDDEIVAAQYAERLNISLSKASSVLESLTKRGILTRRKVWRNRRDVWAYKEIGDDEGDDEKDGEGDSA